MIIEPIISGVVARSAHPIGCQQSVLNQINYVQQATPITAAGPKKVLILGASSGFGLASRIALAFGGAQADTIGVSFERGPSDKGVGTAGWYNNIYFKQQAEKAGLIAKNFVGDAFSPALREQVIEYINSEFGGKVDLVIYSLATGVRPDPQTNELWRSVIKTTGEPFTGHMVSLETDEFMPMTLETATNDEIGATVKVMGGEDWLSWINVLAKADVLAQGCKTFAYSYIGPEQTYPIYHYGTLGRAKAHLHQTAQQLDQQLAEIGGSAHVAVCKALVTKASVFIPTFSPYILALYKVMKAKGTHEGCIEQMQRLYADKVYNVNQVEVDANGLIRVDDWELAADVQAEVRQLMAQMDASNYAQIGDYQGYKTEFMQLNGFELAGVDYQQDIDINELAKLQP